MSRLLHLVVSAFAIGCITAQARAQTPGIDFASLGSKGFNYTQGSYSLGWVFQTNEAITITSLGVYDANKAGITGDHRVGIYDLTTHSLLTSTSVLPTDPLMGFFNYHTVSPITLPSNHQYAIQSVTGSNYYAVDVNIAQTPAAVSYVGTASDPSNSSATDIVYPTSFTGNIFGSPLPPDFHGDFGPNFLFNPASSSSVPEPAPVALLVGLMSAGIPLLLRRRTAKAA